MSIESTRATMEKYFAGDHDVGDVMADDVVFTIMGTSQEHKGPEAVQQMLDYFYKIAFEARAERKHIIFGESSASAEFDFVGKHIGEFAGVPASGKEVRVPLCVNYDLEGGKIKRARVYFELPVFLQQVGAA